MRLLLISNSTNAGEAYLEYPMPYIQNFLGEKILKTVFIPYAGVSISWDDYTNRVRERFAEIGQNELISVHDTENPVEAIQNAELIVVGGGNTFNLLKTMQDHGLIEAIRSRVLSGIPYIGWSAGSNMACPTIRTTNDMPIVEPKDFNALKLIPFQINPHYLDANPEGHAGETREARIEEFIIANPDIYVLGLREGSMLLHENNTLKLLGERNARLFKYKEEPRELSPGTDLSFLL
jgi:dipeptidase E